MRAKTILTKKDFLVLAACILLLLANLASIGSGGRRRAREALCASNLHRWGVIFLTFANDNGGYFADRTPMREWIDTLWSYYSDEPKLLLCPEATKSWEEGGVNPHMAGVKYSRFVEVPITLNYSYGANLWIANRVGTKSIGGCIGSYWRTPYIGGAADCPLLIDSQHRDIQCYPSDEPPLYEQDLWTPGPVNEIRRACINRHNGVNAVFMDGSVRKIGLKHLWRLRWFPDWNDFIQYTPQPGAWPPWMDNFKEPE